jgi:hypothetical protein
MTRALLAAALLIVAPAEDCTPDDLTPAELCDLCHADDEVPVAYCEALCGPTPTETEE